MSARKIYTGKRNGCQTVEVFVHRVTDDEGTVHEPLPLRLDLWNHSPTGFNWGYTGSGPSQLALAILADYLGVEGEQVAIHLHTQFMRDVLGPQQADEWTMHGQVVADFLEAVAATPIDRDPPVSGGAK
jgi:hypothetical protein